MLPSAAPSQVYETDIPASRTPRWYVVAGIAFAATYGPWPCFMANQHTYLLHGLAQSGIGYLQEDFLASTRDPTPLFSLLIAWMFPLFAKQGLYALWLLLIVAYGWSLCELMRAIHTEARSCVARSLWLLAALLLLHSVVVHHSVIRKYIDPLFGELPLRGVAGGQSILSHYLQPSLFGILFVPTLLLFCKRRYTASFACAAIPAIFHPTYLITAAMLIAGFLLQLTREGCPTRRFVRLCAAPLLLMLPVAAYVLMVFGHTDSETAEHGHRILVEYRQPHHADPLVWCNWRTCVKAIIVGLAILWLRGTNLLVPLLAIVIVSVSCTLLQLLTGSNTMALAYPWRVWSVLVPVASAVLATGVAGWVYEKCSARLGCKWEWWAMACASAAVVAVCVGGIEKTRRTFEWFFDRPSNALVSAVFEGADRGDLYLVPPRAKELWRLRLDSGVRVFVDWKNHPYRPDEVIDWYKRIEQAEHIYAALDSGNGDILSRKAVQAGITHIVAPARGSREEGPLREEYRDAQWIVFRLER